MDRKQILYHLNIIEEALREKSCEDGDRFFWNRGGLGYSAIQSVQRIKELMSLSNYQEGDNVLS